MAHKTILMLGKRRVQHCLSHLVSSFVANFNVVIFKDDFCSIGILYILHPVNSVNPVSVSFGSLVFT